MADPKETESNGAGATSAQGRPSWADELAGEAAACTRELARELAILEAEERAEAAAKASRTKTNGPLQARIVAAAAPIVAWAGETEVAGTAYENEGLRWLPMRRFSAPEPVQSVGVSLTWRGGPPALVLMDAHGAELTQPDAIDADTLTQVAWYLETQRPWEDIRSHVRERRRDATGGMGGPEKPSARKVARKVLAALGTLPRPKEPRPGPMPTWAARAWAASAPFRHWCAVHDLDATGKLAIKSRYVHLGKAGSTSVDLHWYLDGQTLQLNRRDIREAADLEGRGEAELRGLVDYFRSEAPWEALRAWLSGVR